MASMLALSSLFGCGAEAAAWVDPAAVPAPKRGAGHVETIDLDEKSLTLGVEIQAFFKRTLSFSRTKGTLTLSAADPEATRLAFTVDLKSAESTPGFVADVAKAEFLHVDRFPTAKVDFVSVRGPADGLEVFARIELHGTTRTLRVPATLELEGCRVRLRSAFTFDRRAFGVAASGTLDEVVNAEVEVVAAVDARRPGCRGAR
jgi:polyisoprenoid-binding protein YceI